MNSNSIWSNYIANKYIGYYILNNRGKYNIYYGPFKNKEFASFFNFIAFCSPRDLNVEKMSEKNIIFLKERPEKLQHPKEMFASNSQFALWLRDIYEKSTTTKLILDIANESGALGYKAFSNWLINGSQINGLHLANLE